MTMTLLDFELFLVTAKNHLLNRIVIDLEHYFHTTSRNTTSTLLLGTLLVEHGFSWNTTWWPPPPHFNYSLKHLFIFQILTNFSNSFTTDSNVSTVFILTDWYFIKSFFSWTEKKEALLYNLELKRYLFNSKKRAITLV